MAYRLGQLVIRKVEKYRRQYKSRVQYNVKAPTIEML